MQFTMKPAGIWGRRASAALAAVLAIAASACSSGESATAPTEGPTLPGSPIQVPVLRQSAFVFDVDVRNGRVRVTEPGAPVLRGGKGSNGQNLSILSNDVIAVQTSNFFASPVGAITPNRIRVYFDVTINNKLGNVELITPTFPTAPAGQSGVLLFPFSTNVLTTSGGAGASGNEVLVELPSNGNVNPSPDWNGNASPDQASFPALPGVGGNPFNFFNDGSCTAAPPAGGVSDCFRYETFGPIPAGATSTARRVGFDIDGSVGQFRARLIVAADLRSGIAPTGTVAGIVSSPQRGPLSGVSVQVSGVANPLVTDAAGAFSTSVGIGPRSVTILTATLPAGCTTITPANGQSVTVNGGATATQNYSVTCTAATGTVSGTITRAGTGTQSLTGITVRVNPDAVGLVDVTSGVAGTAGSVTYSATVPIGSGAGAGAGVVSLENLPTDCAVTAPAAGTAAYTGLTLGGTQVASFTVTCTPPPPPPAFLRVIHQFGAVAGGVVDLTTSYDPSFCNVLLNPSCPTNLAFAGAGATITLGGSAVTRLSRTGAQATPNFGVATLGAPFPITAFSAVTTNIGGYSTIQTISIIRFAIAAGAAGSVSTTTTAPDFADPDGNTIVLVTSGPGQNATFVEATVAIP